MAHMEITEMDSSFSSRCWSFTHSSWVRTILLCLGGLPRFFLNALIWFEGSGLLSLRESITSAMASLNFWEVLDCESSSKKSAKGLIASGITKELTQTIMILMKYTNRACQRKTRELGSPVEFAWGHLDPIFQLEHFRLIWPCNINLSSDYVCWPPWISPKLYPNHVPMDISMIIYCI